MRFSPKYLDEHGLTKQYFHGDTHTANRSDMKRLGFSEGDHIYVLGFPMELAGKDRNYVVVRGGVIARVRDCIQNVEPTFLVDTAAFPGNSGGPVVFAPDAISVEGTSSINSAYLIGVVAGYLTYRDVAVSKQTGNPRVLFEENSGLATVYPIDYVHEAIDLLEKETARPGKPEESPSKLPPEGEPGTGTSTPPG